MADYYDAASTKARFAKPDTKRAEEHFRDLTRVFPEYTRALDTLTARLRRAIDFAVAGAAQGDAAPTNVWTFVEDGFWDGMDVNVIKFGLRSEFPNWDVVCDRTNVSLELK